MWEVYLEFRDGSTKTKQIEAVDEIQATREAKEGEDGEQLAFVDAKLIPKAPHPEAPPVPVDEEPDPDVKALVHITHE